MGSRYRYDGAFGCAYPTRTWRDWLIVFDDGEEVRCKKADAIRLGKLALRNGKDVHVYEETITRTIYHSTRTIDEDRFRIEITDRLRFEIKLEDIAKGSTA